MKNLAEPDCEKLKAALLAGYAGLPPLDPGLLDLFIALRGVTYVGWIVPRMGEERVEARDRRFIQAARELCAAWLARRG